MPRADWRDGIDRFREDLGKVIIEDDWIKANYLVPYDGIGEGMDAEKVKARNDLYDDRRPKMHPRLKSMLSLVSEMRKLVPGMRERRRDGEGKRIVRFSASRYRADVGGRLKRLIADGMTVRAHLAGAGSTASADARVAAAFDRMRGDLDELERDLTVLCSSTEFSEEEFAERARAEREARQRRAEEERREKEREAEEARRRAEEERRENERKAEEARLEKQRQAEAERQAEARARKRSVGCYLSGIGLYLSLMLLIYEIYFASNLFVSGVAFFVGGCCLLLLCYYSCSE